MIFSVGTTIRPKNRWSPWILTRRSRASRIVSSRLLWTFRTYQTSSGGGSASGAGTGTGCAGCGGGAGNGLGRRRGRILVVGRAAIGRRLLDPIQRRGLGRGGSIGPVVGGA